tara:strand:+ start:366 stop:575 length:210 start_codon:yes stop_codon:yes gene_type:complete
MPSMQRRTGGMVIMDALLRDLEKMNKQLRVLSEYQLLLERRVNKLFLRLEDYVKKEKRLESSGNKGDGV